MAKRNNGASLLDTLEKSQSYRWIDIISTVSGFLQVASAFFLLLVAILKPTIPSIPFGVKITNGHILLAWFIVFLSYFVFLRTRLDKLYKDRSISFWRFYAGHAFFEFADPLFLFVLPFLLLLALLFYVGWNAFWSLLLLFAIFIAGLRLIYIIIIWLPKAIGSLFS